MSSEIESKDISLDDLPVGDRPDDVKPMMFVNYARKQSLRRSGGYIYGWWAPSFAGACLHNYTGAIQEGSVISLKEVGRCNNGDVIVRAEHH